MGARWWWTDLLISPVVLHNSSVDWAPGSRFWHSSPQLVVDIPKDCRLFIQKYLNLNFGIPTRWGASPSSPHSTSLGIRPSSIRLPWPSHCNCLLSIIVNNVCILTRFRTSSLMILSFHSTPRSLLRQHMWYESIHLSCHTYGMQSIHCLIKERLWCKHSGQPSWPECSVCCWTKHDQSSDWK